jgi:nucleoside-diphosphate-sugar epimerase
MKKILILGGTGFIGRNLVESFCHDNKYKVTATSFSKEPFNLENISWIKADLTRKEGIEKVFSSEFSYDIVIQAAASTSGIMDTVNRPDFHITDNVIMNSLILREINRLKIEHFIFFSCTTMLQPSVEPQDESQFTGDVDPIEKYFGVGWTKVYIEKLCKFYSNMGKTRFSVIRHSNVYGPWDRYQLHNSHVCGSTITKVLSSSGEIEVWGNGEEKRDLLYIDDLVDLVKKIIHKQDSSYCLVNAGGGNLISVTELSKTIIQIAQKNINIKYDSTKPTINFSVTLDNSLAKELFDWVPQTKLQEGLANTIIFWRKNYLQLM